MSNRKEMFIVTVGLLLLVLAAGCLGHAESKSNISYCEKVERALLEDGKNCTCQKSKTTPKELQNISVTTKCKCVCQINGTWQSFNVAKSGGINNTKVVR